MVNSLEFGGKPTAGGIPTSIVEKNLGGVTFEGVDGDLPSAGQNPKVTEATTFKNESEFPF
jgi:hypothetical protein